MRQLELFGAETPEQPTPAPAEKSQHDTLNAERNQLQAAVERTLNQAEPPERKAPPLMRPDRQQVFESPHYDWPEPIHDRDTITVDRISDDIDGPAHRFAIQRHDFVEVFFSSSKVDYGYVVGISHSRQEVRVAFNEPYSSANGIWFGVGCIYPAVERINQVQESAAASTIKTTQNQVRQAKQRLLNNPEAYASVKKIELTYLRSLKDRPKLTSTQDSVAFFKQYWKDNPAHDQEVFVVANCNTKHQVMSVVVVTIGTLDASLVHPREVFKSAFIEGASAIVVSHNHPSGDHTASREDHQVTERLTEIGNLIGITVLDHVIYADGTGEAISIREHA